MIVKIIFVVISIILFILGYFLGKNALNKTVGGYIHVARAGTDDPQIFLELTNREDIDKMMKNGYVTLKVTRD